MNEETYKVTSSKLFFWDNCPDLSLKYFEFVAFSLEFAKKP
jgi:hypothetical protein